MANAKLLNVQLLDSAAFELVTGLDPPHAPMPAGMYEKTGAVFFQMQRQEGKEVGVAGDWPSLVGVAEVAARDSRRDGGKQILLGEPDDEANGRIDGYKERSLYFPVVLLDVDDTIPPFKGVVENLGDPDMDLE